MLCLDIAWKYSERTKIFYFFLILCIHAGIDMHCIIIYVFLNNCKDKLHSNGCTSPVFYWTERNHLREWPGFNLLSPESEVRAKKAPQAGFWGGWVPAAAGLPAENWAGWWGVYLSVHSTGKLHQGTGQWVDLVGVAALLLHCLVLPCEEQKRSQKIIISPDVWPLRTSWDAPHANPCYVSCHKVFKSLQWGKKRSFFEINFSFWIFQSSTFQTNYPFLTAQSMNMELLERKGVGLSTCFIS